MMMNTKQRILEEERLQDFVGDVNKHFEDLAKWYKKDTERIKNIRESFWRKYPEIFNDSSENEVEMETTMETESRPIVDREEKLQKVEEKLLSNKTKERFTTYDGVMPDNGLTLPEKVILLQRAIDDATRRKIYYASLQGQLLEKCFLQSRKVNEETLEKMEITMQWSIFLRKLHKLILSYSELQFCTVFLHFFRSNFKMIKEICECNKDRWK